MAGAAIAMGEEAFDGARADDATRAHAYSLLGALLARAPGDELLALLAGVEDPVGAAREHGELAPAWSALRIAARRASPAPLAEEYQALFIGIGRGEVVPYASWYLTGFMMDRPLAELRADLAALGFERRDQVSEPEDHAAALLETMAMLVAEAPADLATQRRFFERHLGPWMRVLFADLQHAEQARFYRAVGMLGEQFIDFEERYLGMPS